MKNKETLEEVAESDLYLELNKIIDGGKDLPKGFNVSRGEAIDYAFEIALKCAKWQSERMYSEEEVVNILIKAYIDIQKRKISNQAVLASWFEQFKKK